MRELHHMKKREENDHSSKKKRKRKSTILLDTSPVVLFAKLSQSSHNNEGSDSVIAYVSQALTPVEQYSQTERGSSNPVGM